MDINLEKKISKNQSIQMRAFFSFKYPAVASCAQAVRHSEWTESVRAAGRAVGEFDARQNREIVFHQAKCIRSFFRLQGSPLWSFSMSSVSQRPVSVTSERRTNRLSGIKVALVYDRSYLIRRQMTPFFASQFRHLRHLILDPLNNRNNLSPN